MKFNQVMKYILKFFSNRVYTERGIFLLITKLFIYVNSVVIK